MRSLQRGWIPSEEETRLTGVYGYAINKSNEVSDSDETEVA